MISTDGSDSDDDDFAPAPDTGKIAAAPDISDKKIAHLQVVVHACRYLVPANLVKGKSDPYVKILLLDSSGKVIESAKTAVKKRTLNPVYDGQVFNKFKYSTVFTVLQVQVWNKTYFGSDEFLGQVEYTVDTLVAEDEISGWMKLQPRAGKATNVQGEIRLQIYFSKTTPATYYFTKDQPALFVTVLEGRNIDPWPSQDQESIKSRPTFNSSNPYYFVKFGGECFKGPQLKRTYHPMWNQQHCFKLDDNTSNGLDSTGVLEIKVMHWDRLSAILLDKHIGSVSIPLSDFLPAVTVDKWYSLEGGNAHKAWIRVLVKHHDPEKMRRHIAGMCGLFGLVVFLGILLEMLVRYFIAVPYLGLVGGVTAGFYYNLPGNVWNLYQNSFMYLPFLNPLQKSTSAPEALQPLSGLGLSHYNMSLQPKKKRALPQDDQARNKYQLTRTMSRQQLPKEMLSEVVDSPRRLSSMSATSTPLLSSRNSGRMAGPPQTRMDYLTASLHYLEVLIIDVPRPLWLVVFVLVVTGLVNSWNQCLALAGGLSFGALMMVHDRKKKELMMPPAVVGRKGSYRIDEE